MTDRVEHLPAERCECGVVSRGLVDGKCADCRASSNRACGAESEHDGIHPCNREAGHDGPHANQWKTSWVDAIPNRVPDTPTTPARHSPRAAASDLPDEGLSEPGVSAPPGSDATRNRVYAVEWGNEFPAEIDSLWATREDAEKACAAKDYDGWRVTEWTVG